MSRGSKHYRLLYIDDVDLSIELDREDDGRWIWSAGAPNLRAFVPNPTERLPRAPTEFAAADPGVRAGSLSRSLQ